MNSNLLEVKHTIPHIKEDDTVFNTKDREYIQLLNNLPATVHEKYNNFQHNLALEAIQNLLNAANQYFDSEQPWITKKTDQIRTNTVLFYNNRNN